MKQKKVPMRTCVVTKEKYPKKELIRVVRDNTGKVTNTSALERLSCTTDEDRSSISKLDAISTCKKIFRSFNT